MVSAVDKTQSLSIDNQSSPAMGQTIQSDKKDTLDVDKDKTGNSLQFNDSINQRHTGKEDTFFNDDSNWYELRASGEMPQRRGYHSSFIYKNK